MLTLSTIRAGTLSIFIFVALAMISSFIGANIRQWASANEQDRYIVKFTQWISIGPKWRRWLWLCLALSAAVFVWSLLPQTIQDQNKAELLQTTTNNQAAALPGDSLVSNTGTILTNRIIGNTIINGRPDQLTITMNNGKINNNIMNDNFVDENVSLLNNTGTIDYNEMMRNRMMRSTDSRSGGNEPPFHVVDERPPIRDREGTFTCSFRIQMANQAKVDYLTVALQTNGLLGFGIISDPRAVMLNPFVGYTIAKVNHPEGVLTVLGRYPKAACDHGRRFSWGKNADWQATSLMPKP
jgi:hypothetical protein